MIKGARDTSSKPKKEYAVEFESNAIRQLKKLDNSVKILIKKWMDKHLVGTQNPRLQGKALVGDKSGYWRYRVGDYRIIVRIEDSKLLIIAISIAHRSEVYD